MHHMKRLRLRDWLVQKIKEGKYGLKWVGDPKERTFRVLWKHGSRHGWSVDYAALFQAGALYTGKYKEGRDTPRRPSKVEDEFQVCVKLLCLIFKKYGERAGGKDIQNIQDDEAISW